MRTMSRLKARISASDKSDMARSLTSRISGDMVAARRRPRGVSRMKLLRRSSADFADRHQPFALQELNRDHRGRALAADAPGQLAARQPVFFPKLAQIAPLADRDAMRLGLDIHRALPCLGELTDVIADAARQRDELVVGGGRSRFGEGANGAHNEPTGNSIDIY